MIYRIYVDGHSVDLAVEYEVALMKYKRYKNDMEAGYSRCVELTKAIDPRGMEETVLKDVRE